MKKNRGFNAKVVFPGIFLILFGWLGLPSLKAFFYDPIGLAIEQLTNMGMPPPAGYDISAAGKGELGKELGHTDSETMTIKVDLVKLNNVQVNVDEGSPATYVNLVAAVLVHEYGHTPDYGAPSDPGEPGYGNGTCAHMDLYESSTNDLCSMIHELASTGGEIKALCRLHQAWLNVFNSNLDEHNKKCDPNKSKIWTCEPCVE